MTPAKVTIKLLGGVVIRQNGAAVGGFASRKAEALLIYLACNPRPHPRETLAALLWPENDQNRALGNLSVALTSLRKQLAPYLLAERHTIAFNAGADCEVDTAVFQEAIHAAQEQKRQRNKLSRTSAAQLRSAVSLYRGDFLAGFNVRNAPDFEAWALLEQERLRQMFLTALADLIAFHQQRGQLSAAIGHAQRLLAADPLQENIHRQLMRLYAQDNQRPAALSQYEQCARILDEELGVEPDEETAALYEQIRGDGVTGWQGGRVTSSLPHNLPTAANAFIGREVELERIREWLAEPAGRLLTITGPGGMGKTRLAQEAARAHLGHFADGVWLVSLVAFQDLQGAATAVAEAAGLSLSGKEEILTQLLDRLKPLEALLVLDNLEHLLTPGLRDFLSQLTQVAPDLRLVATSRERLRLQAERVLDLDGLPFPPAIQLFTNRAGRVQVDFAWEKQATDVARLCQVVGGLPLALELAATWTRVLSVAEIVAEIERGLDALTTTLHDVPERHRSLRAVIESSWQMLPAAEQSLLRQLAVFRGGFTRAAAEQVTKATLPQLMSLADRSFLQLDEDQRFRRHPLLLQFAREQLAAHPAELDAAQAVHARFFANFVESHEKSLPGKNALAALAALAADLENIRAAWQWALSSRDETRLNQMATGIGRFFADHSRYLEGAAFFAESLVIMRQWPATAGRDRLIAKVQVELGNFWHENGRFAEAESILREANQLARQHNLIPTRLLALRYLGEVVGDQGDREAARMYLEEARQLCQSYGDMAREDVGHGDVGHGDVGHGDVGHEDVEQELLLLWRLGALYTDDGAYEQAQAAYGEAMVLAQSLGNRLHLARLHNGIAVVANRQQAYEEAIRHWQLAREGFQAWGHDWGLAATSHNLAMAYFGLEQYDTALETITAAIAAHEKIGHRRGMAGGLAVMASICLKQGRRREARRHYCASLQLSQEIGATWLAVVTLVDVAELEMSYGALQRAALLLFFVVKHPATLALTLENAQKLLEELRAELPDRMMAEAQTAAQSVTLDELIAQVVAK